MHLQLPSRYVLGLDLGQAQDHTALAVLEWQLRPWPEPGKPITPTNYRVPSLKRWPAGTSYREIIEVLARFLQTPPFSQAYPTLVIDDTGAGLPVARMVVDGLARAGANFCSCRATITDGHDVLHKADAQWHVPKKILVSVLQVLLQSRRLQVSNRLPETPMLMKELQTFRAKITAVHNDTVETWRDRDYDDLVLAVALASWWAERKKDWFVQDRVNQYSPDYDYMVVT